MQGYFVAGHDNDSYAYREAPEREPTSPTDRLIQALVPDLSGASRPGLRRCASCGDRLTRSDGPIEGLRLKKRRQDISSTYDGVMIVSKALITVYERMSMFGLEFTSLPDDPVFSSVEATSTVEFDLRSPGLRFAKPCPLCGRYESIVGPMPVLLQEGRSIPDLGFVQSDLEFGSNDSKSRIFFCGKSCGDILKVSKLRGLCLTKI